MIKKVADGVCTSKKFTVIDEDENLHSVYAYSEKDAALKYAQDSNCERDYYLLEDSIEITVNDIKFKISAEEDIHYYVDEI
jgi:hypothetical protein